MDETRLDWLARRLAAAPRRSVLRALAGVALASLVGVPGDGLAAKGCLTEGKDCRRDKECCSGLCTGKAGRKACRRAPSQSICTVRNDLCVTGEAQDCGLGPLQCACTRPRRRGGPSAPRPPAPARRAAATSNARWRWGRAACVRAAGSGRLRHALRAALPRPGLVLSSSQPPCDRLPTAEALQSALGLVSEEAVDVAFARLGVIVEETVALAEAITAEHPDVID